MTKYPPLTVLLYLLAVCSQVSLAGSATRADGLTTTANGVSTNGRDRVAKRVKGSFEGHEFEVVNKWFGGLKLYHTVSSSRGIISS